jgi:hypothetical protein
VVSDGSRFVVLRATASLRALRGEAVAMTHDAKGRTLAGRIASKDIKL